MPITYKAEIYRKMIHLSSLWMVFAIYYLDQMQAVTLFGGLLISVMLFEILRLKSKYAKIITSKYMGYILRAHETTNSYFQLTGAFYVVLAALLAALILPKTIAITAFSIMILADTVAALIGRKYGQPNIFGKSLEGSVAFFITAAFILILASDLGVAIGWGGIIAIALIATFLELFSQKIRIDDNLSIVMGVGLSLSTYLYFKF